MQGERLRLLLRLAGSRAAPRRRPRAARRSAPWSRPAAGSRGRAGGRPAPRPSRGCARSRRTSRRRATTLATPTAVRGDRPGLLEQPVEHQLAGGGEDQHRRHQVRAAALVLLGRAGRVVRARLVGADRLVLDPVVGGEVAVAERHHAPGPGRARPGRARGRRLLLPLPQRPAGGGGDDHRRDHPDVLEGQPRRRAACIRTSGISRKASASRSGPRSSGTRPASPGASTGFGPRRPRSRRCRRGPRPPRRWARGSAARCGAPSRPAAGRLLAPRSVRRPRSGASLTRASASAGRRRSGRRARRRRRAPARRRRGSAAPPRAAGSGGAGRSRRRRHRGRRSGTSCCR